MLQPNTYLLVVRDRTVEQNFHLLGSRVKRQDGNRGTKTTRKWSVYLSPGSYSYRSDRNKALNGAFIVAGSPPA